MIRVTVYKIRNSSWMENNWMIKYNCAFLVINKIIIILIVKNLRLFEKMIAFFRLLIEKKYKFMYNIT